MLQLLTYLFKLLSGAAGPAVHYWFGASNTFCFCIAFCGSAYLGVLFKNLIYLFVNQPNFTVHHMLLKFFFLLLELLFLLFNLTRDIFLLRLLIMYK